jgi:hypothetical protein
LQHGVRTTTRPWVSFPLTLATLVRRYVPWT